jgi:hypothetical protein
MSKLRIGYRIFINFIILFSGYNIFNKITSHKNDFEKSPKLNLYPNNTDPNNRLMNYFMISKFNKKLKILFNKLSKKTFFKIIKFNIHKKCILNLKKDNFNISECNINKYYKLEKINILENEKVNYKDNIWLDENDINPGDLNYYNIIDDDYDFYQNDSNFDSIFNDILKKNLKLNNKTLEIENKIFHKIFSGLYFNYKFLKGIKPKSKRDRRLPYLNITNILNVIENKEEIENFFYLYSFLIRVFIKSETILTSYDFRTQKYHKKITPIITEIYNKNKENLNSLIDSYNNIKLDYINFLQSKNIDIIKIQLKNISSNIDCISCDKNKQFLKFQLFGITTMFKILFSGENNLLSTLTRNELASFINLINIISNSINTLYEIDDSIKQAHFQMKLKYVSISCIMIFLWYYINFQVVKTNEELIDVNPLNKGKKHKKYKID